MTQRSHRLRVAALLAVPAALLLAACGATNAPLKVGVRDVATTLLLGSGGQATVQAPVPPVVVKVGAPPKPKPKPSPTPSSATLTAPGFTPPPPATSSHSTHSAPSTTTPSTTTATTAPPSSSSPPPDTCPAGDPLAVPKLPAPSTVQQLPAQASYDELVTGSITKAGRSVALPATAKWTVGAPVTDWTGSYTFAQSVQTGGQTTTTTYRVVPQLNAAPTQLNGAALDPGIYLASVGGTGLTTFTPPDPGLELASFPLRPGSAVTTSATDGTRTMSYTATVKGLETVNACGTPVAAWQVDLADATITDSSIAGADGTQTFTATYAIGTQFGGIVLASSSKVTGSDGGVPVTRTVVTAPTAAPVAGTASLPFACLPPDPATPPVDTAPASPHGGVPATALAYRSVGVLGTGSTTRTRLPWDAAWHVRNGAHGSYTVHRVTDAGAADTTYLVVPVGSRTTPPGLYLESFATGDSTFTAPPPGLQLAAFPLTAGARLTGVQATDGTAQVSFTSVVAGHANVGTCDGHNLDAWEIDLVGGTYTDTAHQTTMGFTGSLFAGTQYGALILGQSVRASGTTLLPASPTSPTSSSSAVPSSTAPSGPPSTSPTPSPSSSTSGPPVPTRVQVESTDTINEQPK